MERKRKILDFASAATLLLTLVLFAFALVEKGFTHELLLEAGVFLVSAKLVIGNYQAKASIAAIQDKLDLLLKK